MPTLITRMWGFSRPTWNHVLDQNTAGASQTYSELLLSCEAKWDHNTSQTKKTKTLTTSQELFFRWKLTRHRSLRRLQASKHESAMPQADAIIYIHMCQLLTCFLVGLLVGPDDGAEVGEHQRAQSTGSLLRSGVVVEWVLAQHEPVPTLLNPVSSNLPQQPPFKERTHTWQLWNDGTQGL